MAQVALKDCTQPNSNPGDHKRIRGQYSNLWIAVTRLVQRPADLEGE